MKLTTANEGMTAARKLPCLLLTQDRVCSYFTTIWKQAQIMMMMWIKDKLLAHLRTRLWPVLESFPETRVLSMLSGVRAGS